MVLPLWVIGAKAGNMVGPRHSRDSQRPKGPCVLSSGHCKAASYPRTAATPAALTLPEVRLPQALHHLLCTHSSAPPDSGLGGGCSRQPSSRVGAFQPRGCTVSTQHTACFITYETAKLQLCPGRLSTYLTLAKTVSSKMCTQL